MFLLLLLSLWACGREGGGRRGPYFPEIADMTLVLLHRPSGEEGDTRRGGQAEGGRVLLDRYSLFFMDRYEVTKEEYRGFLDRSGWRPEDARVFLDDWTRDPSGAWIPPEGKGDHPVVYVNHDDAKAYARFLGKDLPSRRQWLQAALRREGRYPWGDTFSTFFCNTLRSDIGGTTRVGTFENGKSGWGCYDMVGNVAEWSDTLSSEAEAVERSYDILGGSWNDGGPSDEKWGPLNLSRPPRSAEAGSRNNTLGFRCVRNDALRYIERTFLPRAAALSPEERAEAFQEIAPVSDELYGVLKLIQFEHAVLRRLPLAAGPVMAARLRPRRPVGEEDVLVCYADGRCGRYTLRGEPVWTATGPEERAPYTYRLVESPRRDRQGVLRQSVWKNHLAFLDAASGRTCWSISQEGQEHVLPLDQDPGGGTGALLLVRSIRDRYEDLPIRPPAWPPVFPLLDRFYDWIRFWSQVLFPERETAPEGRWAGELHPTPGGGGRLGFITAAPSPEELERNLFNVTAFGAAALYLGPEMRDRFRVQLYHGGFWSMEDREAPGSFVSLLDMEHGSARWTRSFPEDLFAFQGVVQSPPLLLPDGEGVLFFLSEDAFHDWPSRPDRIRVCRIRLRDGAFLDYRDLSMKGEGGTALSDPTPFPGGGLFIEDGRVLGILPLAGESGAPRLAAPMRISIPEIMEGVDTWLEVGAEGGVKSAVPAVTGGPGKARRDEEKLPESLDHLLSLPQGPWLLSGVTGTGRSYLFTGFDGRRFRTAFVLPGAYPRQVVLSPVRPGRSGRFLLLLGSANDLICFDGEKGRLLWHRNLGEVVEAHPVPADLDGDGAMEVLVTSPYGEIKAVSIARGRVMLHLKVLGAGFEALLPVPLAGERRQGMLAALGEEGLFLLDPRRPPRSSLERDLVQVLAALEKWKWPEVHP